MLTEKQVGKWLEKFDSNDCGGLLTDILNNKIKSEEMIDSIYAYDVGETERAIQSHKEMWRNET